MKTFFKMNLPNKLTTLRMLAVVVLIVLVLIPWNGIPNGDNFFKSWISATNNFNIEWLRYTMLAIFVLASLTDFLDGYLARKNNIVTTYGKFMDPIADKLLVNTMLIILSGWGIIPIECTIIMIGRDIFVDALRLIMIEKGKVIAANKWGKAKTVLQMIAITSVFLFPLLNITISLDIILCYIATVVSLISGILYFVQNRKAMFADGENNE